MRSTCPSPRANELVHAHASALDRPRAGKADEEDANATSGGGRSRTHQFPFSRAMASSLSHVPSGFSSVRHRPTHSDESGPQKKRRKHKATARSRI